ncbi:hypothetical protein [Mucilaginibacter sp. UYCu711]|uniref:hypothetical protein n=1 Tax=Mucilaginibacter sp. UYCu711 TaxID=3156339 RepID=UPI003D24DDC1
MQPININSVVKNENDRDKWFKHGIWAYFLLLIFEGALRKWFLPGLATPLLVIRDPIAIWLVYTSWKRGILPSSIYLKVILVLGIMGIYTAVFIGHGNVWVALYGARILLFHFPLIFVIGQVFNREDIIKMGKVTLYIAIPMIVLIYLQFKSPQSDWVNRGVGGDMAGAGFSGSGDFLRPPGTFSFTNGTSLYFGWLAPFVFYFWLNSKKVNKVLLIAASVAMISSIPISISRTLFFEVCLTMAFTLMVALRKPEYIGKVLIAVIAGGIVLALLSQTSFFKTASGAFTDRFDSANEQEGGLVKGVLIDRVLGGLVTALVGSANQPFFGFGLGMGTNVGSMLLSGKQTFLISEAEWGRLIGEMGPLMGLGVIFVRVGLTLKFAAASYRKMVIGDSLPWLLLSFAFINVSQGQWAQPTSLGFSTLIGGLLLASLKNDEESFQPIS